MRKKITFERWENPFEGVSEEFLFESFLEKNFNTWVAHTNFELSPKTIESLWDVDGIEVMEALTRYRLKFSVGPLFNEEEVKFAINRYLLFQDHLQLDLTPELQEQVNKAKSVLTDWDYWAIIVLPNGKMETVFSKVNDRTFESKYELFRAAQQAVGAHVEGYDSISLGSTGDYSRGDYD